MEIKECIYKTKCDLGGCKNLADYTIIRQQKSILSICKDCIKEFSEVSRTVFVPKSIPAPYKKQKKI